jgi:hypothetical protein
LCRFGLFSYVIIKLINMIKKLKNFFQNNTLLILSILFLVLFSGAMKLFAADPPPPVGGYSPGDTLDPGCAPGSSVDCMVNISSSFVAGSDTQVQYNDGGYLGSDANFVWDKNSHFLKAGLLTNVQIGNDAGSSITTGTNNIAIGVNTLKNITNSYWNIAIGESALENQTGGAMNIAIGYNTLKAGGFGGNNHAVGEVALEMNAWGADNNAFGEAALENNIDGNNNNAFGNYTAAMNLHGSHNTFIGAGSFFTGTTVSGSVGLGNNAGYWETGDNKLYIDNQGRGSEANGRSRALIYGEFNFNAANQILKTNSAFTATYSTTTPNIYGVGNSLTISSTAGLSKGKIYFGNSAFNENENKLGVGTDSPANVLDVVGPALDTTVVSISTTGGNTCSFSTTTGSFSCVSDIGLKHDVNQIDGEDALTKILYLNPVTYHYNWQNETEDFVPGFIAQEFEDVFPSMVSVDSKTGYKSLSYAPLMPYAVKAIQELDLKIENIYNFATQNSWTDRLISWLGNTANGIEKIFTKEISTENLCVKKSDGTEVCITGDQLDQILINAGTSGSPAPDPTPDSTPTEETCSDGIQNQDETGIDTGGVCVTGDEAEEVASEPEAIPEPEPVLEPLPEI